jgi:hypothetical protein
MIGRRGIHRRELLGWMSGVFVFRGVAVPLEVERVVRDNPLPATSKQSGSYRADASVLFLGMSLLKRKNVGGGYIHFEEAQAENARRFNITFKAGSLPDRAAGLNRMGYIQEICVEEKSALREAAYFGIMTSSPEESFADAKGAIEKQNKEGLRYTAIDGVNRAGAARSASHKWVFPPEFDWSKCDALVNTALDRVRSAEAKWRQVDTEGGATSATFLYVVLQALRSESKRSVAKYVFGPERFRLTTDKGSESNGTTRLKGEIVNETTGKKTNFSAWFKADSALPYRIEFQPKSYLRLSFEAV